MKKPEYYIDLLTEAAESKNKQAIIKVYDLIEESDVEFYNTPKHISDKYDKLVEKCNSIVYGC